MFCKVCGHCLPSCSGYIDITPSSSQVTKRADVKLLPHQPKQATVPWVNAQVNARLEYDRSRKRDKRAAETPEEREARLQKMRDYNASRKVADKERKKKQLANETPEQREARLQRMRDYRARSKSVEKRQVRPGEKRATMERVRAIRANWTEEEKKEDRMKAKERMARLRKSRTVEEQNKV